MSQKKPLSQRWADFRPTKVQWIWSCIGAAVLTMIVGFTAGGWVTGGTATQMTENAISETRSEMVANLCVDKFVGSTNAKDQLAALKEADSWDRDNMIKDGGWTTIAGLTEEVNGAADLCAEQLVAMDSLPATTGNSTIDG